MRFLTLVDLDPGALAPAFEKVRAAIERGDLRSPDVKKLAGSEYHRAKLDASNRLLLQFVVHEGARACLALEIIENHAYDRSRFLRGATFDEADIAREPVADEPAAAPCRYLHPKRAHFHFVGKPISLDDAQDHVHRLRLPVLLVGAAGSGKTAVTLEKMRRAPGDALFVTQSPYLAETARGLYEAGFERDGDATADFLSFRELLESIRLPAGRPVTFRDFRAFFQRHAQGLRSTDAHRAFEELRGVIGAPADGPLGREAYLALGARQSIYAPSEREAIFELFGKYRRFLDEGGLYDTNFVAHAYRPLAEPRYDLVVVDEVQDLTPAELVLALATLRKPSELLLAGDANQVVHPSFFSWAAVKTLLFQDPARAERQRVEVLDANFRNPRAVTRLANGLLQIKNARFGSLDKESTSLVRPVADDEGSVRTISSAGRSLAELDRRTKRSADVAVLVLRDEDKAAARAHFATPLLFSVHEAKGLEYETVILFRFVSSERRAYAEACEGVTPADLATDELRYARPKDRGDKTFEAYKFFVNALYVAVTRAVRDVVLVEDDPAHPLLTLLAVRTGDAGNVATKESSTEVWQREARRLELQGKDEQASAIREGILRAAKTPWTPIDRAGFRALAEKALAPGSIFTKAKTQLLEYALVHDLHVVVDRLGRAGFAPAKPQSVRNDAKRRAIEPYTRVGKAALWDVDRYGPDHRSPHGLTPLMLAAAAGNRETLEALLARGARPDLVDDQGRTALHWALLRAYAGEDLRTLGACWELLAPESFDLLVDGRLVKLVKKQGEYFFFVAMTAWYGRLYREALALPKPCFGADDFVYTDRSVPKQSVFARLPANVLAPHRRSPQYVNHMLARNEVASKRTPNRKLWVRESRGAYVPNWQLSVRVPSGIGRDTEWRPLHAALGLERIEEHLLRRSTALLGHR